MKKGESSIIELSYGDVSVYTLTEWKTTVTLTQKALTHILDYHSQDCQIDKAKQLKKTYFAGGKEELFEVIHDSLEELLESIEFERENWIQIPFYKNKKNDIHFLRLSKNRIVQIQATAKNSFKIISLYPDGDWKK